MNRHALDGLAEEDEDEDEHEHEHEHEHEQEEPPHWHLDQRLERGFYEALSVHMTRMGNLLNDAALSMSTTAENWVLRVQKQALI